MALEEREKAELRDRLEAERIERERLEKANAQLEAAAKEAAFEKMMKGGWFRRIIENFYGYFERRREGSLEWRRSAFEAKASHNNYGYGAFSRTPFRSSSNGAWWKIGLAIFFLGGLIVLYVRHELYDLREGFVTDKTYVPAYTTTSTDGHGHTTTTYHPPQWIIDVTYQGDTGEWSVTEGDYNNLRYGQWACVTDFGYRCQGEPRRGDHFPREHYTLSGEEAGQ
jgi:hypothetical protein